MEIEGLVKENHVMMCDRYNPSGSPPYLGLIAAISERTYSFMIDLVHSFQTNVQRRHLE